jgi:hypothetical protein
MDYEKLQSFREGNPMSVCTCGHTGDGGNSQHERGGFQHGHGRCAVKGCNCPQFTWVRWTDEAKNALNLK